MQLAASTPLWFCAIRYALFGLLAINAALYLYAGTLAKALDAIAWFVLLVLFAIETGFFSLPMPPPAMRLCRLAASLGVCAAGAGYLMERNTLDAINTGLWIAVVVLLEVEVAKPNAVAQFRPLFKGAAIGLYASLAVLVLIWAWRGEWFDAYDALLWLIAFAAIEIDVLAVPLPAART